MQYYYPSCGGGGGSSSSSSLADKYLGYILRSSSGLVFILDGPRRPAFWEQGLCRKKKANWLTIAANLRKALGHKVVLKEKRPKLYAWW